MLSNVGKTGKSKMAAINRNDPASTIPPGRSRLAANSPKLKASSLSIGYKKRPYLLKHKYTTYEWNVYNSKIIKYNVYIWCTRHLGRQWRERRKCEGSDALLPTYRSTRTFNDCIHIRCFINTGIPINSLN